MMEISRVPTHPQLQEGGGPDSVLMTQIRPPLLPSHPLGQEFSLKHSLQPPVTTSVASLSSGGPLPAQYPWGQAPPLPIPKTQHPSGATGND